MGDLRSRLIASLAILALLFPTPALADDVEPVELPEENDPEVIALMVEANDQLAALGLDIALEQIEFFTIGERRPSNRIHQQPFRWVPSEPAPPCRWRADHLSR